MATKKDAPVKSTTRINLGVRFVKDPAAFAFYAQYLVPVIETAGERALAKYAALAKGAKPSLWRRFYKAEEEMAQHLLNLLDERKGTIK